MSDEKAPPVRIPIDGILDLHTFQPRDAPSVVAEYIRACREKGITDVRIIHGKGRGVLRRTVHAVLQKHPDVSGFRLDPGASGWGATLVLLKK
ncbi:MAG: DNA mismatch repair protein MutS [Deltaproteobacteria bacterium]|nr:MAG: DNA mismatch repair protein MutS [Deltaproteobacteria bacterium]